MDCVGIYRLSGNASSIQKLRLSFIESKLLRRNLAIILTDGVITDDDFDLKRHSKEEDVNVIAGLLKLYFRELSDPLMTFHLYDHFVNAMRSCLL